MKSFDEFIDKRRPSGPSLSEFPKEVGGRLRRQRMAFEWRQTDLAVHAGVSVQTIKSAEKGGPISYESLIRLLIALGHGTDFLRMLEAPHFPNLSAQERFVESEPTERLEAKRVRPKARSVK